MVTIVVGEPSDLRSLLRPHSLGLETHRFGATLPWTMRVWLRWLN